jgi:D-alanyl-D-alanine carboxypeptidase
MLQAGPPVQTPPGAETAVPLEATAENRFPIEGVVTIEFEKGKMTVKRRGGERVFTKDK